MGTFMVFILSLGIYITFPIWNMISKNASEREFKYILIILFIFASIIKTLNTMGFNIVFIIIFQIYIHFGFYVVQGIIEDFLIYPKKEQLL